jgi:tetratricopeptide (TPR) repeat protein
MKLNRFDEAKEKTERALMSPDENNRTRALNTMGAIESTLDHAQAAFNLFVQLVDEVKSRHWEMQSAFLCNAGEAAMILNRFDDAEHYLIEATEHFDTRSYSDPWELLSVLYADEGRLPEAVDSVKRMHRWSRAREPALEQQSWAFEQQVSAEVLFALGYNDKGLDILRRVLDRPDRRGAVTGSADESESGLLMTVQYALRLRQAELGEQMSWIPFGKQWLANWMERITLSRQVWQADSRVAALVVQNHRLEWSLRPYAADSSVVEWMRGDMCNVLGAGVTEAEVDRLLARDSQDASREEPYLQLIKGECELHRWAWRDARETLEKALPRLPAAEVLLHARGEALLAQACQHMGDSQAAVDHLQRAMERFPGIVRALQMSIPVSILANGDAACQEAARMLNHSPRFENVGGGFTIDVTTQGNSLTGSLRSPNGSVLCNVSSPMGTDAAESARQFCLAFHNKAFASQMDLSQTDITSLDGSNQTGEAERRQLEQILTPGKGTPDDGLIPTPSPSTFDAHDLLR